MGGSPAHGLNRGLGEAIICYVGQCKVRLYKRIRSEKQKSRDRPFRPICRRRRTRRARLRPTSARSELIAIQQRIVERLKNEIQSSIGKNPPAIEIYYEEYWKELDRYQRISSRRELVDACAAADVVYCGDYHTLRQAQATAVKLIEELLARGRDVTVAVEMVASDRQHALDRYVAGEIDDESFLAEIDYTNTWDFHWEPYRCLLALCRREGLRALAINSDPKDAASRVVERDVHAAQIIAQATLERSGSLVFVLDGDLHVARDHLPFVVDSLLKARGASRRKVLIHQNADPIYWRLAEEGLEREEVVRLADDAFCVISATPLVKLQSYLNWEQNHDELCSLRHGDGGGRLRRAGDDEEDEDGYDSGHPDYAEKVQEIIATIAGFLGIAAPGLDDFSVYTTGDLDFLAKLGRDGRFSRAEISEIKRQVRAGESYFIPRVNIIYLADLTTWRAAEEASHFINSVCAGFEGKRRDARDAFYYRAVREAIGFFGSRIIDHKRCCMSFDDFSEFIASRRARHLDPFEGRIRAIGRLALRHRGAERAWLAGGKFSGEGAIHQKAPALVNGVAHALGYILGDKLYNALASGRVTKEYVRGLYHDPLRPGAAERRYLELVKKLEGVAHRAPAESERF